MQPATGPWLAAIACRSPGFFFGCFPQKTAMDEVHSVKSGRHHLGIDFWQASGPAAARRGAAKRSDPRTQHRRLDRNRPRQALHSEKETGSGSTTSDEGSACRYRSKLRADVERDRRNEGDRCPDPVVLNPISAGQPPTAGIGRRHPRGFFGGACHGGIIPHQVLRDRAVDKQGELGGKPVSVGDIELQQQLADPEPPAYLEGGPRFSSPPSFFTTQFGDHVASRRTAAKIPRRETPLPASRSLPGIYSAGSFSKARSSTQAARQLGRSQVILQRVSRLSRRPLSHTTTQAAMVLTPTAQGAPSR